MFTQTRGARRQQACKQANRQNNTRTFSALNHGTLIVTYCSSDPLVSLTSARRRFYHCSALTRTAGGFGWISAYSEVIHPSTRRAGDALRPDRSRITRHSSLDGRHHHRSAVKGAATMAKQTTKAKRHTPKTSREMDPHELTFARTNLVQACSRMLPGENVAGRLSATPGRK